MAKMTYIAINYQCISILKYGTCSTNTLQDVLQGDQKNLDFTKVVYEKIFGSIKK